MLSSTRRGGPDSRGAVILAARLLLLVLLSSGAPLEATLVSRWSFDGDLRDSAPAGNHGATADGSAPSFAAPARSGLGQSLRLDGGEGFVEIAPETGLPASAGAAWSLAFWVRADAGGGGTVYAEAGEGEEPASFRIGVETGGRGRVEVTIRSAGGAPLLDAVRSVAEVLDGQWHHIAWIDEGGQGRLRVDGTLDPADFSYERAGSITRGRVAIGAFPIPDRSPRFAGALDELAVWDHALSEAEALALLDLESCPPEGDTHCGRLEVDPPPGGLGEAGTYTLRAVGSRDDSGDEVRYTFRVRETAGRELVAGPSAEPAALFELGSGEWTPSLVVDDDFLCSDAAPDAACTAAAISIGCPAAGDTHCGRLEVTGPGDGGPGQYTLEVRGARDDTGDPVLYSFVGEDESGRTLRIDAGEKPFIVAGLSEGRWRFRAVVDDDPLCDDAALDAECEELEFAVGCPPEGDTHCAGLQVDPPPGGEYVPGPYALSVLSARDDSRDVVLYAFRAESLEGGRLEAGPQDLASTTFFLGEGTWTIEAWTDDDLLCADRAADFACDPEEIVVGPGPRELISRWPLDGDIFDAGPSGNHGLFLGEADAEFTAGFDGTPSGALLLGAESACVEIARERGLPLALHAAHSIALWVRGPPQAGAAVWAEAGLTGGGSSSLFAIGPEPTGSTGQVAVTLRTWAGRDLLAGRVSSRVAFDDRWHHIAWVEDRGRAALWIDGVRDPARFDHRPVPGRFDSSGIGCVAERGGGSFFRGAIDDVRIWSYALEEEEILELIPEPEGCPAEGDTTCEGLDVEGPEGDLPGEWTLRARAEDASEDPPLYTFVATRERGERLQLGPGLSPEATFELGEGSWSLEVTADDDLACRDRAARSSCQRSVVVRPPPPRLVARWPLDGSLAGEGADPADAALLGGGAPRFVDDRAGAPEAALALDGRRDLLLLDSSGIRSPRGWRASTVALRVRAEPQTAARLWVESSSADSAPLFSLGPETRGGGGRIEAYLADGSGIVDLPRVASEGVVFDGRWHHVAWVDREGDAELWIDGERDGADFTYRWRGIALDTLSIGGVPGGAECCLLEGEVDDVRLYDHALDPAALAELARGPRLPFRRGDADGDGGVNITDAIAFLNYLFLGGPAPACREAADADDSGALVITDGVYLLNYLFLGGAPPPEPGPAACGFDPAGSADLGCERSESCVGGG